MTFIIPNQQTKKHQQLNRNDLSGTIFKSRNISLDEEGYVKLAETSYAMMTQDDNADYDAPDAMYPMDTALYVNADELFSGTVGFDTFSSHVADTNSPSPGVEDDVIFFNDVEVVSDGTIIKYQGTAGVWTTVTPGSFSSSNPIAMTVWGAENSLAVGNGNLVKFISTAWAVNGTFITLPNEYIVTSLNSNGSYLYIFTRSKSGGEAKAFVASTIATSADAMYGCGAFEIFSSTPFQDSIAIITSLGRVQRFNGGGFSDLAILPVYTTNMEWASSLSNASRIANRGMVADGDLIYINLSSFIENGRFQTLPNFPSGVWCYDDANKSLYHKYSPTYTRVKSIAGTAVTVNATNNNFTLTSGNLNDVITGMPLMYSDDFSTSIPELLKGVTYYVIKDSSTVFKIASSYTNALAGTAIDITGTGNTGQDFYIFRINDYGWTLYDNRMAVAVLHSRLFNEFVAGRVAFSADLASKQDITSPLSVLNGISPYLPNRGYFVTPKLESSSIEDQWQRVYIKHKPLSVDEKIIVKYKSKDTKGFPFSSVQFSDTTKYIASWTDTDTFTTTCDLSSVVEGDEIEIIAGVGSGHIAYVSSISVNSGTYTVSLDEAFPYVVSGDDFYFNVDKWLLLGTITSSEEESDYFKSFVIDQATPSIQLKVEMRGVDVTINEIQLFNKQQTLNGGV